MTTPIGLYYPYVHFRDDAWLKLAALYWPQLARITPYGRSPFDSPVTRALSDELDFVLDLFTRPALMKASRIAAGAVGRYGPRLREIYRIPPRAVRSVGGYSNTGEDVVEYRFAALDASVQAEPPEMRWPGPIAGPVTDESFTRLIALSQLKAQPSLLEQLREHHLAVADDLDHVVAVHPNFAWAYMCLLADEMARHGNLVPVSDDASAHEACGDWDADRFASVLLGGAEANLEQPKVQIGLGMLALQLAVPADLASVPVGKIIEIRKRYGAEFDAFHELTGTVTADLAAELAHVRDPVVAEAYLRQEVARRFDRPLEELRRSMRGLGVDSVLGATAVKFELPAAAALAAGGWAGGQPVVTAAGAALGVTSWLRSSRRARQEAVRASPIGYLWRVERDLDGGKLVRRLLRRRA